MKKTSILIIFLAFFAITSSFSQNKDKTSKEKDKKEEKKSDDDDKLYENFIKKSTIKKGMFNIIEKQTDTGIDFFFEIPDSLLSRDFLVVNKISQVPMQLNEAGINKGINYENKFIIFEKDKAQKKLWVKTYDPTVISPSQDAISLSVRDNFAPSVMEFFEIHTYNTDSTSVVVKVNKIFDGDQKSFNDVLTNTGLQGSVQKSHSLIQSMKPFENNIVVKSLLTTMVNEGSGTHPISIGVTSNILVLPKEVMTPRFEDERVGYFTKDKWFFDDNQHALVKKKIITRWRLEPKEKDIQKYLNGELVEPKKPIVFYIDPSTPKKWRQYIIDGVYDWNQAFEKAGFKNVISAKIPDENDQDFDLDDVRYSGITYVASPKANAMGPSVIDPRSGEILEADIVWWHNVMSLLHDWIRVQTANINPKAQKNIFPDELMGESVKFVSSHEVGHTLGLKHNMGSSFAYDVEDLRNPEFIKKNNIATSIMDYARYNYVAQTEDKVPNINPVIGHYDKYAIEWGYRWFENEQKERDFLLKFVNERAQNPLYFYGQQQSSKEAIDPRSQAEDLGNNSVKASEYGLQNLKKIMSNLLRWTTQDNENYYKSAKLYAQVINQWQLYNSHILTNVGGFYLNNLIYNDQQSTYIPVEFDKQKQAVEYLNENVFTIPEWLFLDKEILKKTFPIKDTPIGSLETSPYTLAREYQYSVLYDLFDDNRILRLLEAELLSEEKIFSAQDLFSMVRGHIFSKTKKSKSLSLLERMTQKNYVDALIVSNQKLFEKTSKRIALTDVMHLNCAHSHLDGKEFNQINFSSLKRVSEVTTLKKQELEEVLKLIKNAGGDAPTKAHYKDLSQRIKQEIDDM